MKCIKFIILLLILFWAPMCFADETPEFIKQLRGYLEYNENIEDYNSNYIYLEPESKIFINLSQPQVLNSKSLNTKNINLHVFNPDISKHSVFSSQEHAIKNTYGDYSQKYGNLTIGTVYDSFIDDADMTYSTGIYTKLDWKRFALTMAAKTETGSSYSYYNDKLILAPELKLTKRLSLLDIAQTDVKQSVQKNEIVLRYNPKLKKHPDDLFLELGAGQTYREQDFVKSSIRFSTRFKF